MFHRIMKAVELTKNLDGKRSPVKYFRKTLHLNVWQGFEYAFVFYQASHGIRETNSLEELCTVVLQNNCSRKFLKPKKNHLNKKWTASSVYFPEHHQVPVSEFTRKGVCRPNLPSLWKHYWGLYWSLWSSLCFRE